MISYIIYSIIGLVVLYIVYKFFIKIMKLILILVILGVGLFFITPEYDIKKDINKSYKYSKFLTTTKVGRKITWLYTKSEIKKIKKEYFD